MTATPLSKLRRGDVVSMFGHRYPVARVTPALADAVHVTFADGSYTHGPKTHTVEVVGGVA